MHVTPADLRAALNEVDFPADKETLVRAAQAAGATDDVVQSLRSAPPAVQYANADEVVASVRQT